MDCIIIAGGIAGPEDPLYPYTQGKPKALLDINGRTMLERVVDALENARYVDEIVVVGLGSDLGMRFPRPVHHLPDQGSLVGNAIAGIQWLMQHKPDTDRVLLCSADIPAITGELIDKFIEMCRPFDKAVYYTFITQEVMEARFPTSKRTYVKLTDASIAGGDVVLAQADLAESHHELWVALSNARKHAWQIARIVGLRLMIKLLLRRLSIADIEATGQRIIGRPIKVILCPYAELGMDVDKPHQVELLREDFRKREA